MRKEKVHFAINGNRIVAARKERHELKEPVEDFLKDSPGAEITYDELEINVES